MRTLGTEPVEAEARARELRAAIKCLWPDREDPGVNSEVVVLLAELRKIKKGVTGGQMAQQ